MKILVVSSEATPFAKTGGLGDVVGALPRSLARLGHEVKVFLPQYQTVRLGGYPYHPLSMPLEIVVNGTSHKADCGYVKDKRTNLSFYFVKNGYYFDRPELYKDPSTGSDYADNDERFLFFTQAVIRYIQRLEWRPDVIHVHDWQAGLIPVFLKTTLSSNPFFKGVKSVLTIHNLAYQGSFEGTRFSRLGLPEDLFYATAPFEFYGKVNFLKAAIHFADKITTVSERYSREIQTPEFGAGLHGVLQKRSTDITGILNGVDYSVWSPSRDKRIPHTYYPANLSGKKMNKVELLNRAGLPIREKTLLIGMISRLADQKGFDLIAEAADDMFAMNLQMIVLGTGEDKYHSLLGKLEMKHPRKLKAYLTFDDALAHQIEAGADAFLMPSHFEPCGLNQMYSLKYGTVPIVRRVGGLADTVRDFDPVSQEGTGFVFEDYDSESMLAAIERAVEIYPKRRTWGKLVKAAMKQDYSWDKAARKYDRLFNSLISG